MENMKKHPINIVSVFPICLSIKANVEPNPLEGVQIPYIFETNHSTYNSENKTISVMVKFEIQEAKGEAAKQPPYIMLVELQAHFIVDESMFPVDKIDDWAKRNAPIVLYPFLRERVYALTIQAGFMPLLLPLVEVPTFRIEQSKKD